MSGSRQPESKKKKLSLKSVSRKLQRSKTTPAEKLKNARRKLKRAATSVSEKFSGPQDHSQGIEDESITPNFDDPVYNTSNDADSFSDGDDVVLTTEHLTAQEALRTLLRKDNHSISTQTESEEETSDLAERINDVSPPNDIPPPPPPSVLVSNVPLPPEPGFTVPSQQPQKQVGSGDSLLDAIKNARKNLKEVSTAKPSEAPVSIIPEPEVEVPTKEHLPPLNQTTQETVIPLLSDEEDNVDFTDIVQDELREAFERLWMVCNSDEYINQTENLRLELIELNKTLQDNVDSDKKIEAINLFEQNYGSSSSSGWSKIGKAVAAFAVAAAVAVGCAVIGALIGAAATSWSGPGAALGAFIGALKGGVVGWQLGVAIGAGAVGAAAGGVTAFGLFREKKTPLQEDVCGFANTARNTINPACEHLL